MAFSNRLVRCPETLLISGKSKSGLYDDISRGLFTSPVKIGARAAAWPLNEIEAINAARIAGHSSEQIRSLVTQLETARASLAAPTLSTGG